MTLLPMLRRCGTVSTLFISAVALSGCPGGGGSTDTFVAQQAYLKASNPGPGDLFGTAMAFDGDTLVIGAPFEDSGVTGNQADNTASGSGAVYVFTKSAGVWSQQAYLKASTIGAGDNFGTSVALDGNTLVVGAPFEDSGVTGNQADNTASDSGAVYVFTRTNGVWSQEAYLKASTIGAGDNFGHSVALDGDTLVIGAPFEDSGVTGNQADNTASGSGAVYVFTKSAGVWSQLAYLKASTIEAGDNYGTSVALDGNTLVVGTPLEDSNVTSNQADNSASDSGAVYVFTRTNGVWSQEAYLKASTIGAGDNFGHSVALDGNTLVVGAIEEDSNATGVNGDQSSNSASGSGGGYVFTRTNGVWSQQAYLKASNAEGGDNFGASVALSSDTVVIGAFNEDGNGIGVNLNQADNSASGSGAAYIFTRTNGVWSQQAYLKASNSESGDHFGNSVAVSGGQLVVGANAEGSALTGVTTGSPNEAITGNGASISGAVYLFGPQ